MKCYRALAALLCLGMAGCATTGKAPNPAPKPAAKPQSEALPKGSGDSIDEHLFVPPWLAAEGAAAPDAEITQHYENTWKRLVDRFALPDCSDHKTAVSWAHWYADRPDYMARVMKRAQPWVYFIAEELEKRDLPGELALLPVVESAYDPFAYSSGRAMGTWQFISSTGRTYGLKQNWWYDGRRDVWASTRAAFDYLEYLDKMFDGDWLLALAGYNSGENRVARLIRHNQKRGKPTDFWNLKLPRETAGYVPKLLGLTCLFKNPAEYGFQLPFTPNEPVVTAVKMQTQTDLVLLSQMTGVSIDVLFGLNPGYNRWATSPDGPWRVILPVEAAATLKKKLQSGATQNLMKWDQVIVQNGDTLSQLASRHHVPVSVLRSSNGLSGDLIRVGQRLRLPRDEQMLVDPLYVQAARELQKLQAGLIASKRVTHKVRPGESLSVIARRYKVSVRELQNWNHISNPRLLRAGQTLTLFQSPAPKAPRTGTIRHTVRRGDSLWSISRHYKVKVSDLLRWNDLSRDSVIRPGQSIRIEL
ncbi:MAG: LysM peptidoglycan-binding domain-containing protein [Lysobacterales bacterium]